MPLVASGEAVCSSGEIRQKMPQTGDRVRKVDLQGVAHVFILQW